MRKRRLLLAATALIACKKTQPKLEEIHANPKGSFYDDAMVEKAPTVDAAQAAAADAGVQPDAATVQDAGAPVDAIVHRLPANPKGTRYDKGLDPVPTKK